MYFFIPALQSVMSKLHVPVTETIFELVKRLRAIFHFFNYTDHY